jgi:ankyrin repeat protein
MPASCNQYQKIILLIFLLIISSGLYSQVVVLDTTMEMNHPLSINEQLDMNNYLLLASSSGVVPAIHWLLRHGAEVDCKTGENATALMLAVASNKTEAVKAILQYKPDVDVMTLYSETPLLASVKNGNIEIAEALIRDSADINLADINGATPLHYASIYGSFYITDMLLYYNAKIDIKSVDGTTPLMAAIWSGYADIADILIQNGANCEEKDNQGFTPLMLAAQNGDTIIMEMLLQKRVNLYELNNFKYDALDNSIRSNQKEVIEYLFRKGYKWDRKLPNTINPYSVAVKYGRIDITRILKKNQVPENHHFGFDQVAISTSIKFSFHDYFTGINLALKEPLLNTGIIAGLDIKPGYTRVLVKVNDYTYYQYYDKSSIAYAGIFKDIPLTNHPFGGNWFFNSSVAAAYAFGNKLRGTNIAPGNQFKIIPSLGFKWTGSNISLYGNFDYMKTKFYRIGPVWLRLGIAYNMFLDNERAPGKTIKWY